MTTSAPDEADVLTTSYLPADTSVDLIDLTVPALLADRAAAHPDRLALVGTRHGDGAEVRLTYGELYDEAQRVATAIRQLAEPGEHVAIWAPNVVEWVLVQHGAALAGVVLVALNPVLRRAELEYAVDHSRCTVLLHADSSRDYDMRSVAAEVAAERPHLRLVSLSDRATWRAEEVDPAVVTAAPSDPELPVMLQYTSGTTGNPKGVLLRHRSLVNVAKLTMEYVDMPAGAVTINPLPMFHTAACVIGTLGPLWLAGTEVLVEQFAPVPVLETMRREQVEVLFFVPAVLGALLEAQRVSDQPAPQLKVALGGASNLPATMIEATEQTFGAAVTNLFGQTELSPVLTATRPGDAREDKLRTVGHPLPQVDVKIVDPLNQVVPLGVPGEICARGYQQLIEYLHDPEATAATVDADGFVHTGDLGAMDERGYITLTGRLKELIIRGGENIAPAGIESCLAEHPAVLSATVFGIPDDRMGEIVGAGVHLREPSAAEDPAALAASLIAHCKERLSPYKVPSRWFLAGDLPATPTGKVQKFKLLDLLDTPALREITPR
ncbi:fatty-acyl-CoA synthase/long-chain acyl-CoA synthetase [Nocardioides sp. J9]|uniref:class I adenylate-forming enzyme family protein n=1 Tax=Nocardioides sp. J9 TaxID=935844 RepID=UPI00119E2906|nr:AMP-binding protein [Nocardioides sp. J9]TWG91679.1 fatty-acyl-CoA synthase/long-chain acyl-CoA synthetase [Nocardioides sp. J9]